MLEVETNHQIILLFFREGKSIRAIAKKLEIHRSTVKARIEQYERFKAAPSSDQDNPKSLVSQYLKTGAVYDSSNRKKRKLSEDIIAIIDKCLLENEAKRLDGRKKQQAKKIDIHELIEASGHSISYSIVCDYIRTKTLQTREAFIRQSYGEGSCCEFDWGEVKIHINGRLRRCYMAAFTSACSNYRYAQLFQHQDSLAFKEAHINFFEHTGGVYQQMVYDNMRVAIASFVGKTEKVPTEGLLQLSRWYRYQWRFCNIAKGNEKGHVERSVEYVRRKAFVFSDRFDTLEQANTHLCNHVLKLNNRPGTDEGNSATVKLELERKGLSTHPGRMECFAGENCKVDKYSTICFGTNRYSVPDHLIGKMVFAKIYAEGIKIYAGNEVLCQHERLYKRFSWQIDLNHYLVTLRRKPGAVAGSVALKQAPEWVQSMYKDHFVQNSKAFIELLQYCQLNDISSQQVSNCVNKLARQFPSAVDTSHVMALLGNQPDVPEQPLFGTTIDPIALQAYENLQQLEAMMSLN